MSPTLRWALQIGWGAVLLAVVAAALLLQGVMTLSERRAAFVSSVTHELRTPLTTFRMYAEMLAKGMVPDAKRRQEYFNTLQREAERLTLLVENVLAYARLERGRRPQAQDRVTLAALLERVGPRLKQRAAQAGMECELQLDGNAARARIHDGPELSSSRYFSIWWTMRPSMRARRRIGGFMWKRIATAQYVKFDGARSWAGHRRTALVAADAAVWEECAGIGGVGAGRGAGLALCRRLARQLGGRLEIGAATGWRCHACIACCLADGLIESGRLLCPALSLRERRYISCSVRLRYFG